MCLWPFLVKVKGKNVPCWRLMQTVIFLNGSKTALFSSIRLCVSWICHTLLILVQRLASRKQLDNEYNFDMNSEGTDIPKDYFNLTFSWNVRLYCSQSRMPFLNKHPVYIFQYRDSYPPFKISHLRLNNQCDWSKYWNTTLTVVGHF